MKNLGYLLLFFLLFNSGVNAQVELKWSYERKIVSAPGVTLNTRIGVGTLLIVNAAPTVGFNALIGDKKSFLEIGFDGVTIYLINI